MKIIGWLDTTEPSDTSVCAAELNRVALMRCCRLITMPRAIGRQPDSRRAIQPLTITSVGKS